MCLLPSFVSGQVSENRCPRSLSFSRGGRGLGYQLKIEGRLLQQFGGFADASGHRGPLTVELALRWAQSPKDCDQWSSARRLEIVEDYLTDVLTKLADAKQNHPGDLEIGSPYLLDLLPDRWAAAHPQSIRRERVVEKKNIADAKRVRRARRRQEIRKRQLAANQN